ncbi:MAG: hypothetical protein Q9227_003514 [Pyrenula ochraceoflavens]
MLSNYTKREIDPLELDLIFLAQSTFLFVNIERPIISPPELKWLSQAHQIARLPAPTLNPTTSSTLQASDNQSQYTQTASIDLDSILGNVNGALSIGATNFSPTARNVKLSPDCTVLDAELPDVNGDYSTSSCSIQHEINTLDGQLALFFAIGAPHSQIHADADTVEQADAKLTEQVSTVSNQPVHKMVTLHLDDSYQMNNTDANKAWIAQNLGPQGAVGNAMTLGCYGMAIVGGTVKAAQQGSCVLL